MSKKIHFDFDACSRAIGELEECAALLKREIDKMPKSDIYLIRSAWEGETANLFTEKYLSFADELERTEREALLISEDIRRTAMHIRATEEDALRIVISDEG